jgi:cobyrinic acid a,c-diamide synthase
VVTRRIPRLLVAGTSSGSGKTLLTAGLIGALRRRGLVVQPFKCGPDYIDPGYHAHAAGRPCGNLDSWMLDDAQVHDSFLRGCEGADVAVIEGLMGLFDGAGFDTTRASAAQIAALLGAPVLLVMDISGSARSAAAVALGFARFDPGLPVAAVALNFAGSERHALGCGGAVTEVTGLPVLGWLPRDGRLLVPERHLGLLTAGESTDIDAVLSAVADIVAANFDLEALLRLAGAAPGLPEPAPTVPAVVCEAAPVLAVARDAAFSFYYPDNLDLLRAAGARIAFFSPVAGERLPAGAGGVYLGGGYPEVHARALAANTGLWADLHALHARGAPILAECGGFMVLTEALVDTDGVRHAMAGLVPGTTRMTTRLASLGYREATALQDTLLADAGETLRGHEFHYSVWDLGDAASTRAPAFRLRGTRPSVAEAAAGHAERGLLASYLHIHLGQRPALARRLVARLAAPS